MLHMDKLNMIMELLMKSYVSEENNSTIIISNLVLTKHQPNTIVVWFGNYLEQGPDLNIVIILAAIQIFIQSPE